MKILLFLVKLLMELPFRYNYFRYIIIIIIINKGRQCKAGRECSPKTGYPSHTIETHRKREVKVNSCIKKDASNFDQQKK